MCRTPIMGHVSRPVPYPPLYSKIIYVQNPIFIANLQILKILVCLERLRYVEHSERPSVRESHRFGRPYGSRCPGVADPEPVVLGLRFLVLATLHGWPTVIVPCSLKATFVNARDGLLPHGWGGKIWNGRGGVCLR